MRKKFFSLFLSTFLIASVSFAIISVARMVVNKPNEWNGDEPVKIVNDGGSPYKHHYDELSTEQKHTYNQILKNIYSMPEKIEIPSIEKEGLENVFTALLDDNPDLYFIKGYREIQNYGFRTYCKPDYAMTKDEYLESKKKIDEVCRKVISGLSTPENQWQTELEINDYIVDNCEYEYDEKNGFAYSTAYSVFVNGEAACEGYSKAAKMLFDMVGIESMTVRGESISNGKTVDHMWNIVRIDGEYYNFDCTWNDPVQNGKEIKSIADRIEDREKHYKYFNLSDEMIKDTHILDKKQVECTATEGNYFNKTVTVFDEYNRETEEKILLLVSDAIENGKDFVNVRFSDKEDYRDAVDNLGKKGKVNRLFREYEKKNGRKIKTDTIYTVDEEQKILIVIEYA